MDRDGSDAPLFVGGGQQSRLELGHVAHVIDGRVERNRGQQGVHKGAEAAARRALVGKRGVLDRDGVGRGIGRA